MGAHLLARTTHTVELRQVAELNAALSRGRRRLTAGSIGAPTALPDQAVLTSLECQGPPSYPYVFGCFEAAGPAAGTTRVELHTPQLRAICDQLSLRAQTWGLPVATRRGSALARTVV
ncbi:MAG: hypothetical protein ACTHN8_09980 [Angustibacter sp.]